MRPVPRTPDASTEQLLAGATFADAFSIDVDEPSVDASAAADRAFSKTPPWIARLLALRNSLVRPFGIKGTTEVRASAIDRVGFFPCISRTSDRVVMGFNDAHLDFRVAVDVAALADGRSRITATTVVKPHNLFGRTYLACIMPFHKAIVPALLARIVNR
jgi:Protein of unknown function (DUF2867)